MTGPFAPSLAWVLFDMMLTCLGAAWVRAGDKRLGYAAAGVGLLGFVVNLVRLAS